MTIRFTDKQFEFNLWANTELIRLCSTLSEEQLQIEVEGVLGNIPTTIAHIVSGEGAYLGIFNGERPWVPEPDWDNMSIGELLERAEITGAMLVEAAKTLDPAETLTVPWHGETESFVAWVVMTQTIYHGIEHRTQLKILLTQLGVEHQEFAGWSFGYKDDSS